MFNRTYARNYTPRYNNNTPKTITAKFDSNCTACGARCAAGMLVRWTPGTKGVTHVNADACVNAKAAQVNEAKPIPVTANAKPMADFLNAAKDRGLKFPKVAFLGPNNVELKMTLAGPNSKNPGAVFVFLSGNYSGSVAVDGTVRGALANNTEVLNTLATIAGDPAQAAKAYGMLTGSCSFCAKELTDGGSVEVGYGPVCAKKYGLPHKPKGSAKYAELHINSVTGTADITFDVDAMNA